MKIFVTSLHRCGTQSMGLFLQQAGFRTCHWPAYYNQIDYQSLVADLEDQPDRVVDILRPMLEAFDAFSDVPIPAIYPTLDKVYPGSKFIAAYRNPFDWYRSVRRHCAKRPLDPYERVQYWRYLTDRPTHLDEVSADHLVAMFLRHYAEMLAYFDGRQDFLLVDINDLDCGAKIARFLGTSPRKFPHVDRYPSGAAKSISTFRKNWASLEGRKKWSLLLDALPLPILLRLYSKAKRTFWQRKKHQR